MIENMEECIEELCSKFFLKKIEKFFLMNIGIQNHENFLPRNCNYLEHSKKNANDVLKFPIS